LANTDNGSCYFEGDPCDDSDATTVNDVWTQGCECQGVVGIVEMNGVTQMLYPNPGRDEVNVSGNGVWEAYDAAGRKMGTWKLQGPMVITTSDWSMGVYVFRYEGKNYRWIKH
jgi:hypothetical protein